jgi:hypothetical protein
MESTVTIFSLILSSSTCFLASNYGLLGYDIMQAGSIHMNMDAASSSETMAPTYQTTWYSNLGDKYMNHCHENCNFYMFLDLSECHAKYEDFEPGK